MNLRGWYHKIGIHTAPKGTLLNRLHVLIHDLFIRVILKSNPSAPIISTDQVHLAFRVSGGIGDHILSAKYIRDLTQHLGPVSYDIFSSRPQIAKWIFSNLEGFRQLHPETHALESILKRYDAAFWTITFVDVYDRLLHWDKIAQKNQKLVQVCRRIKKFNESLQLCIQYHPNLDGYLAEIALLHKCSRHNFLHFVSGIPHGENKLDLTRDPTTLEKFGLHNKKYITIHNGFDAQEASLRNISTSTKTYPHLNDVIRTLKPQLNDVKIVQIGTLTSTPLPDVDYNLLEKTSLQETTSIIQGSAIHIDGESGLVHLAACLGVRSFVIFGPTSRQYFAYSENYNTTPSDCGNCWWMKDDWLSSCPRGFEKPVCMHNQSAALMAKNVIEFLQTLHQ